MFFTNYYNTQEQRGFPLADSVDGVGDDGTQLPFDVLVDCKLRFPDSLGQFAFLGGVTVTANLVTLVILGADAVDTVSGFTPLASLTITNPEAGIPYQLRPLANGVGGWVVFGAGVTVRGGTITATALRFSSPTQSLLAPKCARAYKLPPIPSLGKAGRNTALTGFVRIVGTGDVEAVKEQIYIGDKFRDALVLRLRQDPDAPNVLEKYIGPCDPRPESRNCPRGAIETINNVKPDCDGNINISFGTLVNGLLEACGGVVLSHDIDLDDACRTTATRREPQDRCADSYDSVDSAAIDATDSDSSIMISSESLACATLPYVTTFDDETADSFVVRSGLFAYETGDAPIESSASASAVAYDISYIAYGGAQRNLSILEACNLVTPQSIVCETALMITTELPLRNGGIVLNYRTVDPLTNPHVEYFFVVVDMNINKIRVLRFNGGMLVQEYASPTALPLAPGYWYRLRVTTSVFGLQTAIAVQLDGLDDGADLSVSFSIATSRFGSPVGMCGVGTDRAKAKFSYFSLENN
jgi:hypothetical protein